MDVVSIASDTSDTTNDSLTVVRGIRSVKFLGIYNRRLLSNLRKLTSILEAYKAKYYDFRKSVQTGESISLIDFVGNGYIYSHKSKILTRNSNRMFKKVEAYQGNLEDPEAKELILSSRELIKQINEVEAIIYQVLDDAFTFIENTFTIVYHEF